MCVFPYFTLFFYAPYQIEAYIGEGPDWQTDFYVRIILLKKFTVAMFPI